MRVLHLAAGKMFGGVERMLLTLARRGQAEAATHEFAVCHPGLLEQKLSAASHRVHMLPPPRLSRFWTVWKSRNALRRIVDQYDVVLVHGLWCHAIFATTIRKRLTPLALYLHDIPNPEHWLDRRAARLPPDLLIANSNFTAGGAAQLFASATVEVVYPPVDIEEAARPERTSDDVIILIASRLARLKGHHILLEALARIKDLPRWRCWIAGATQSSDEIHYERELRDFAARAQIDDRIDWLGHREDVSSLMRRADVYCQPNRVGESFGLTFVEAMVAGLVVVTTAIGAATEVVSDGAGVLIAPNDSTALAAKLKDLINDPNARARFAVAGQARGRAFSNAAAPLARLNRLLAGLIGQKIGGNP